MNAQHRPDSGGRGPSFRAAGQETPTKADCIKVVIADRSRNLAALHERAGNTMRLAIASRLSDPAADRVIAVGSHSMNMVARRHGG